MSSSPKDWLIGFATQLLGAILAALVTNSVTKKSSWAWGTGLASFFLVGVLFLWVSDTEVIVQVNAKPPADSQTSQSQTPQSQTPQDQAPQDQTPQDQTPQPEQAQATPQYSTMDSVGDPPVTTSGNLAPEAVGNAYARLNAYGIVHGIARPDGTVDPALGEPITRAQFVSVLVRGLGREGDASLLKGLQRYSDVPGDHWASGFIAFFQAIANVYGQEPGVMGEFRPDEYLTPIDALRFTMMALGVAPDSHASGPDQYFRGALESSLITDYDRWAIGDEFEVPASRGLAFWMMDSAWANYSGLPNEKTPYTTYIDADPPRLIMDWEPSFVAADRDIIVTGRVEGDFVAVVVNAERVATEVDGRFSISIVLPPGQNEVIVTAFDLAGNATRATSSITYLP